jgi:glutamyl/glutaminyl-tRNA synthetase
MITRLAPTPSGFLHQGNIFNFLLNWYWARLNGGKVLLRIDDADAERKRPEYVEDIFRVLEWLGINWDIGPTGPDDFEKNWSQATRKDLYDAWLNEFIKKELLFACTCSRSKLSFADCNCKEKKISFDAKDSCLRITAGGIVSFKDKQLGPVSKDTSSIRSFVVRRKDGIVAYQLSSLADDRHFGITHIARGEDLLESTLMQLYLDSLCTVPYLKHCSFWHHPLVTKNGRKLTKSAGLLKRSIMHDHKKETLLNDFGKWIGLTEKNRKEIFSTR